MQLGSFGGTYFRPIYSSVTDTQYDDKQWKEFPADWYHTPSLCFDVVCLFWLYLRLGLCVFGVQ